MRQHVKKLDCKKSLQLKDTFHLDVQTKQFDEYDFTCDSPRID